jgi:hypothetical protein
MRRTSYAVNALLVRLASEGRRVYWQEFHARSTCVRRPEGVAAERQQRKTSLVDLPSLGFRKFWVSRDSFS